MSNAPTRGMVLAAGLGKRMRPLTDHIPKPMIEVAGRTMVDRAIDHLEQANVKTIVVNTSYKAEVMEDHLRKRSPNIVFSREAEPLETGGGIYKALSHFGNDAFYAVNGDIIWLDAKVSALARLAQGWDDKTLDALLLVHPVQKAIGYDGKGDFLVDAAGNLTRRGANNSAPYVYAGVQIIHPRLFVDCPQGAFSLNILYDRLLALQPPRIRAIIHDGEWLHVGDPKGKERADHFLSAKE